MNYSSLLNESSAIIDTAVITDLIITSSCSGFKIIDETETKMSYDAKTMTFQISTPASTIDPTKLTTGKANQLVLSDGTTNKWTTLQGDMKIASDGTTTIQAQTIDNSKLRTPSFQLNNVNITLGSANNITSDLITQGSTNKYYSSSQAQTDALAAIRTITSDNITQGSINKYYSSSLAQTDTLATIKTITTDNITQGTTNKYYSSAQAKLDAQFVMPLGPINTSSIYISNGSINSWTTMKGAVLMDPTGKTTLQPFNQIVCSSIKGTFIPPAPAALTISVTTPIIPLTPSPLYIDAGADSSTLFLNKNINLGLLDITGKTIFRGGVGCLGPLEITGVLSLSQMPIIAGKVLAFPGPAQMILYTNPLPLATSNLYCSVNWRWLGSTTGALLLKITPSNITSKIRLTAQFAVKTNTTATTTFSFSGFDASGGTLGGTATTAIGTTVLAGNVAIGPNQTTTVNMTFISAPATISEMNYKLAAMSSVASTTAIIIGSTTTAIYFMIEEILQI